MENLEIPELLQGFLDYKSEKMSHSPDSIQEYYYDLRRFLRFTHLSKSKPEDEELKLCQIGELGADFFRNLGQKQVDDYLFWLSQEKKVQGSSLKRKIAALTTFFRYLKEEEGFDLELKKIPLPQGSRGLPKFLNDQEVEELLHGIQGKHQSRNYAMILLFLHCGLGVSALISLNREDFHGNSLEIRGKGARVLPLSPECQVALEDYLLGRKDELSPLFLSQKGNRISKVQVHKIVGKALELAGLEEGHFSPHKLRHTAALDFLSKGLELRKVQEILGHKNINTTRIYRKICPQ